MDIREDRLGFRQHVVGESMRGQIERGLMLLPFFGVLFLTSYIMGIMFQEEPDILWKVLAFSHIVIWCAVGSLQELNIGAENDQ